MPEVTKSDLESGDFENMNASPFRRWQRLPVRVIRRLRKERTTVLSRPAGKAVAYASQAPRPRVVRTYLPARRGN